MADFQHYATFAEAIEILRDVMETYSLRAIANPPILESPHATTYDALTPEAEGAIRAAGRVLLEGHYTIAPLRFLEREDAERTYYIDTMSGPRLNWVIPRLVETERGVEGVLQAGRRGDQEAHGSRPDSQGRPDMGRETNEAAARQGNCTYRSMKRVFTGCNAAEHI